MSRNILVTGASTGIGYDITRSFINKGYKVYGSVRKQEDADRLASELGSNYRPLLFDVTDAEAIQSAAKYLETELGNEGLGGLVNNAGIAVGGPLLHLPEEDLIKQFDVNVFGLFRTTKAFAPLLGAREDHQNKPGRILQIGSVSGELGMPFIGAYVGSKFAVEGLSDTLRRELLLYGIDVIVIQPGAIKTPIWEKSGTMEANKQYLETPYGTHMERFQNFFVRRAMERGMASDKVGEHVVRVFEKKRPRTRYAMVPQRLINWTIPRMLPKRKLDRIVGKSLGLIS